MGGLGLLVGVISLYVTWSDNSKREIIGTLRQTEAKILRRLQEVPTPAATGLPWAPSVTPPLPSFALPEDREALKPDQPTATAHVPPVKPLSSEVGQPVEVSSLDLSAARLEEYFLLRLAQRSALAKKFPGMRANISSTQSIPYVGDGVGRCELQASVSFQGGQRTLVHVRSFEGQATFGNPTELAIEACHNAVESIFASWELDYPMQ